tara:strand:+ start:602 stop:1480 length:879 start_codon:yes stop_codon:yes gene_type:complete
MYKNIKEFKKFYKKEEEKKEKNCKTIPKVLKVVDPEKLFTKPCNEILPQPPACVIICSPIKTGKTTLLSNLLLNPNFYGKDYFDEVVIISNTIANDITGRFLLKSFTCHSIYKDKIVLDLLKRQDKDGEQNEEGEKDHRKDVALIFDDILGSIKRESVANYISTRFRHYNIKLLVYSTQTPRGIASMVRQNCTDFIMGSPFPNQKEKEKIMEEYGDLYGGQKNLEKIYKLCTPNRYDFMYLSMQDNPPKAYKNFETLIAVGEKILHNDKDISSDESDESDNMDMSSDECNSE